jgi:hypothetical protein
VEPLVPAVHVVEAGGAEPGELVLKWREDVEPGAAQGRGQVGVLDAAAADAGDPSRPVGGGPGCRRGEHVVRVHEPSSGAQRREDLAEQGPLGRIRQVVDGERGDHGVERAAEGIAEVVAGPDLDLPLPPGEPAPGLSEHLLRQVQEHEPGPRPAVEDLLGEQAGPGSEVEDPGLGAGAASPPPIRKNRRSRG